MQESVLVTTPTTNTNIINKAFLDDFKKALDAETRCGWTIYQVGYDEIIKWWAVLSQPVERHSPMVLTPIPEIEFAPRWGRYSQYEIQENNPWWRFWR